MDESRPTYPTHHRTSIQVLGAKCSELRVIDLSYAALISDIALRAIVRCCKVFRSLSPHLCILCERDEWGREIRAGTCHDNHSFMSALIRMVPPLLCSPRWCSLTYIQSHATMRSCNRDSSTSTWPGVRGSASSLLWFVVTSACLCACWWASQCLCDSQFCLCSCPFCHSFRAPCVHIIDLLCCKPQSEEQSR